jgi:hypothetical protein
MNYKKHKVGNKQKRRKSALISPWTTGRKSTKLDYLLKSKFKKEKKNYIA